MYKLDKKDKQILSILDMDARLHVTQIAKEVGLSREVVDYRIKQLEKNQTIEGYYTVINTSKLGLMYCRIFLKYKNMTVEKEKQLLEYCKKSNKVIWVTLGEGKWDFSIVVLASSLKNYEMFYDDLSLKFGMFFQNPYHSIAFEIHHFKHNFLYDKTDTKKEILNQDSKEELGSIDISLLKLISNDARISLVNLANKMKSTPKLVNYRLNKLIERKIILCFRAKINTRLLGYEYYKVFLKLESLNKQNKEKFYTYLHLHPNVIFITKPMGVYNLEFEMMVKNANELHEIMRYLRCEFSELVIDYETILYYDTPIAMYLPPGFDAFS
ncbi:MAG: Lrp/AsnC family transcriptional regulator [Candidatus Woesearchaeota archaeon]|jgi:DNA-binding Lrp family transcriptional regulator